MSVTSFWKISFLKRLIYAVVYLDVLNIFLSHTLKIEDNLGNNEFIFQHDLASPSTVKSTKNSSGRRWYLFLISLQKAQMQIQ